VGCGGAATGAFTGGGACTPPGLITTVAPGGAAACGGATTGAFTGGGACTPPGLITTVAPGGAAGCGGATEGTRGGTGAGAAADLGLGGVCGGAGATGTRAGAAGVAGMAVTGFAGGAGGTGIFVTTVCAGARAAATAGAGVGPGAGLGGAAGCPSSGATGAASATGAPHCSQNSAPRSRGPLQKRQAIVPGGSGGFSKRLVGSTSSPRWSSGKSRGIAFAGLPAGAPTRAGGAAGCDAPQCGQKRIPSVTFLLHLGHGTIAHLLVASI